MPSIGRLKRYARLLSPPIRITVSSAGGNEYQELNAGSVASWSPSPPASYDDYPPPNTSYPPSASLMTPSNHFADASGLVWLELKICNRTVFGVGFPKLIPRSKWDWGRRAYTQRKRRCTRRCTRRQYIVFVAILMLLAVVVPVTVLLHMRHVREVNASKIWGFGLTGVDENGFPLWFNFKPLKFNFGGIKELVPKNENIPEYPLPKDAVDVPATTTYAHASPTEFHAYPDYTSQPYLQEYRGNYVPCRSFIDGEILDASNPLVKAYNGIPFRKPNAVLGSASVLGLDETVCFERNALLMPYGFGENPDVEPRKDWKNSSSISFANVDWGKLQEECVARNKDRFDPSPAVATGLIPSWKLLFEGAKAKRGDSTANYHSRTAVVLRGWDGFRFLPDDIINLRRLITEVSLLSGGEYQVHLIIDVKNLEIPFYADETVYRGIIETIVPKEFRGIVELSNEVMMSAVYPSAPYHDSYRSMFMPLQMFSQKHPEYDFIWEWELDMRLIGDHYHFMEKLAEWAKKQPRRELWERSTRHYIPAVHGTWEEYILPAGFKPIEPPKPPTSSAEEDDYEWGVGEEADLITLLPMFDPAGGSWTLRNECGGYDQSGETVPRRAAIVTASRLSKGLLWRMHEENAKRRHACASEMWPATACLHHGLKAVYAPHPIWFEKDWGNMSFVESVFNGGTKGQTTKESVFGVNEHNFSGTTWFFNAKWARTLYRRWLGYEGSGGGRQADEEHGNMCLNGVLLHPIKTMRP
ncbi:hypothetical protein Dda_1679 [Drechslerella dactyloides]|uniref:Uncharacterized protein n=1 Tax=Drechslerella dactyloides TaxID=74499 RepID=A0AAD6J3X1_DREDA|nr:hypothetical protein Dda_1679 [Drechslerella dactyloides]